MKYLLIVGPLAGLVGLGPRWLSHCFAETWAVFRSVRQILQDAITVGGASTPHYLSDEAREADARLAEIIGDLRPGSGVKGAVKVVVACYRRAFAAAPPQPIVAAQGDWSVSTESDADRGLRERQVEHARDGIEAIDLALRRMRRVERLVIGG